VSKKALIALCIAILLPVVSYLLVRGVSEDAIKMPGHYFPENIVDSISNGKRITDTTWHVVANDTLTNQLGDKVSIGQLRGKIIVADFFFTRCPSICPYLTTNMKHLQESIKPREVTERVDTQFVHFLSFSIDPERDSVPVLKKYASKYRINPDLWWLLTGPKKTIYDFALNEVKLPLQDGQNVDSNFIHTSKFVLIDKKGIVRSYYNGLDTTDLLKLQTDIGLLMLEKDKNEPSIFSELKPLWPIFVAALIGLGIFLWVTMRPRNEPKL
jgi:protein SCO1/2